MLQGVVSANLADDFKTVHAWHFDVQQHDVRGVLLQQRHGIDAVFGRQHVHAVAFQQAAGDLAHGHRVIHYHHQQRPRLFGFYITHRRMTGDLQREQLGVKAPDVRKQVENQHHAAVPQNGRTGNAGYRRKLRAQVFHHDFPRAGQRIHLHRNPLIVYVNEKHRQRLGLWLAAQFRRMTVIEQFAQITQFVTPSAVLVPRRHRVIAGLQLARHHAHDALDAVQRHGVLFFAALNHQRPIDRHRERQTDTEPRTLARFGINDHRAAQVLDLGVHHIHADTAPGNLGDGLGGGKSWPQDELQDVVLAQFGVGADHAALDRLAPHGLEVDTGAVVAHLDNDVAAFVGQAQRDMPPLGFAGGQTFLDALQTMIDGVAQHVLQRRDHAFKHVAVHLALGVDHVELDLLVQLARHLTNDPAQTRHHALERDHARAHQAFLKLGVHPRLLQQQGFGLMGAGVEGFLEVHQVGRRLEQRAG